MLMARLESTTEYERIIEFAAAQGLEYDPEETQDFSDIVGAWKLTQPGDIIIGTIMLGYEDGHYVLHAVAVEPLFRKFGLGKILVKKAMEKARELGGDEVVLIGRAPEFYSKLGFTEIKPEDSPLEFECLSCPQYQVSCHPQIMRHEIPAEGPVL